MDSCEGDRHVFEDHSEICVCGEQARHTTCKCDRCGNTHWLPRRANERLKEFRNVKEVIDLENGGGKKN